MEFVVKSLGFHRIFSFVSFLMPATKLGGGKKKKDQEKLEYEFFLKKKEEKIRKIQAQFFTSFSKMIEREFSNISSFHNNPAKEDYWDELLDFLERTQRRHPKNRAVREMIRLYDKISRAVMWEDAFYGVDCVDSFNAYAVFFRKLKKEIDNFGK